MGSAKGVLAGLIAVGVVGCSGASSGVTGPGAPAPGTSARSSPTGPATGAPAAGQASSDRQTRAGARAAARRFDRLQLASEFAASWDLLAPTAKRLVRRDVWVQVHEGCPAAGPGTVEAFGAVTVFGTVAIVTERLTGARSRPGRAHDVFSYAGGRWGYSPNDLSIYNHASVAADIAAAKAAGLCTGWRSF